jgi:hypothetical protein
MYYKGKANSSLLVDHISLLTLVPNKPTIPRRSELSVGLPCFLSFCETINGPPFFWFLFGFKELRYLERTLNPVYFQVPLFLLPGGLLRRIERVGGGGVSKYICPLLTGICSDKLCEQFRVLVAVDGGPMPGISRIKKRRRRAHKRWRLPWNAQSHSAWEEPGYLSGIALGYGLDDRGFESR